MGNDVLILELLWSAEWFPNLLSPCVKPSVLYYPNIIHDGMSMQQWNVR